MDGRLYVCGSYDKDLSATAQRFHCAKRTWEVLPSMHMRRCLAAAAVVGGRLYVCGGEDPVEDRVHSSIECWDASGPHPHNVSKAGNWRILPTTMSLQRRHLAAAALAGPDQEDLFVCGGQSTPLSLDGRVPVLGSAEALGLREQGPRQRGLPPMKGPRCGHVAASLRGRVYVCGGTTGNGLAVSTVESFDPGSETWSAAPPMQLGRGDAAAVVAAGRLYVLGGWRYLQPGMPCERTVERLDLATGLWELLPWQLSDGRCGFCAGAVWNGRLVA